MKLPASSNSSTGGAALSLWSLRTVLGRWRIQAWPWLSSETLETWPHTHLLGSIGHDGSTSKRGIMRGGLVGDPWATAGVTVAACPSTTMLAAINVAMTSRAVAFMRSPPWPRAKGAICAVVNDAPWHDRRKVSAGTARSMGESAIADFVQVLADSCYGCAGDEEGGLNARRGIGRDLRVGVRGRNRGFRVTARRRTHCGLALLRQRCGRQPLLALDGDQQEQCRQVEDRLGVPYRRCFGRQRQSPQECL